MLVVLLRVVMVIGVVCFFGICILSDFVLVIFCILDIVGFVCWLGVLMFGIIVGEMEMSVFEEVFGFGGGKCWGWVNGVW